MRAVPLGRIRARLEASIAHHGMSIPWWVPLCMTVSSAVFAVAAVAQRGALVPSTVLGGLLALVPVLVWAITGWMMPPWAESVVVIAAVAVLFAEPSTPDFAPFLMVVLAGEVAVMSRPAMAIAVTCASIAVLGVAEVLGHLIGSPLYTTGVLLGLTVGFMIRWYVRALDAERGNQDAAREQAMLGERQRIAREVHDVVAHSLSITMLHLTGARRALQQDRDVDEAADALIEAERVGRAAMADIRRTVGLLAGSPSGTQPLPGIDDIAGLIERTRAAGLDVRYEQRGDLTGIGASDGLGLYRIAQESLANIVKHAPSATAEVRLRAGAAGTRLTVRNSLPAAASSTVARGSGLAGMTARAAQLGAKFQAGPRGEEWVVDVTVAAAPESDALGGCFFKPVVS
ncbi:sensor histidine kinase [Amycolatopsis anabasis]|uniref:sensor histidine kinase n=1 Tax=Amycolatopsis anabasis TaxID=1840409 RepID=UPI001FECE707|nr:histidine kinase [Amycolatopsis anabasis]